MLHSHEKHEGAAEADPVFWVSKFTKNATQVLQHCFCCRGELFFAVVLELDNAFSSLFTMSVIGKEIPEDSGVLFLVGGNIFIGSIFYKAILQLDDMRN